MGNLNAGQDIFVVFACLGIRAGFPNWALLVECWFDWGSIRVPFISVSVVKNVE